MNNSNKKLSLYEFFSTIDSSLKDELYVVPYKRTHLLASILLCLSDDSFRIRYSKVTKPKEMLSLILSTVEEIVDKQNQDWGGIVKAELCSFTLGAKCAQDGGERGIDDSLVSLVRNVDNFSDYREDLISLSYKKYSESSPAGSDLGIVLTPPHITDLFCDLAQLEPSDKVLDLCAGTGGFMLASRRKIGSYLQFMCGVELEPSLFANLFVNSYFFGKDCSSLYLNDAFSIREELKLLGCNKGFINPPYSDSNYSEMEFVELLMDSLTKGGVGVAIVPVNSLSSRTKTHNNVTSTKERLLSKHSLLASVEMPKDLFYPKGTETVILVLKAWEKINRDTWIARYDDGFELLRHRGTRTQTKYSESNHKNLVESFLYKSDTPWSFNKRLSHNDQWVYTLHESVDYCVSDRELQVTLNDYIAYLYKNLYL